MDPEIQSLIKVWFTAVALTIYCYYIAGRIRRGAPRLLFLLPVFYLFTTLPFQLSSIHLGIATVAYLVWLGNFKLLLFSFDQGPLYSTPPLSLIHFISVALLPIKIKPSSSVQSVSNTKVYNYKPALVALKIALLALIVRIHAYRDYLHPYIISAIYCCHLYLGCELVLAIFAVPARAIGLHLEPQFNEPYLATSLQDFWGSRWNLMITDILGPTVYLPVWSISKRILGGRWAPAPPILATFLVSGLLHEVMFYYLLRESPTGEVTLYFVLHGVCVSLEVVIKKALIGRFQLHRAISGPLTVAFVGATSVWLELAPIIRSDIYPKLIMEYSVLGQFVMDRLPLINPSSP